MNKIILFLLFSLLCKPTNSQAMGKITKTNSPEVNAIKKVTEQILNLAINLELYNKTVYEDASEYTPNRCFELYPQALSIAYEDLINGNFKTSLDNHITDFLVHKIAVGSFDAWFNSFVFGKFRGKVLVKLISLITEILEEAKYEEEVAKEIITTNSTNSKSIIKTLIQFLFYKQRFPPKSLRDDFDWKYLLVRTKKGTELNYEKMFSQKEVMPLEHLLELAPLIYDSNPIKKLQLNFNQLENLPETIYALSDLEEIYLIGNKLQALPQSLLRLPKLKKIEIDQSLYANLPKAFLDKLKAKNIIINVYTK